MLTRQQALSELQLMFLAATNATERNRIRAIASFVSAQAPAPLPAAPIAQPSVEEGQTAQLERVTHRIARHIRAFYHLHGVGAQFHMDDLRRFVQQRDPATSPDSPSRVMRDLRAKDKLDYQVLSRRQSLYQILRVP